MDKSGYVMLALVWAIALLVSLWLAYQLPTHYLTIQIWWERQRILNGLIILDFNVLAWLLIIAPVLVATIISVKVKPQ